MQPGEKQLGEMQLGEMQHFNTTTLGEMQLGEILTLNRTCYYTIIVRIHACVLVHFLIWKKRLRLWLSVYNISKSCGSIIVIESIDDVMIWNTLCGYPDTHLI
ncbi:hypothetical protein U3516DRAFT_752756 [Neocallimastix sp. 'constans']